VKWFAIFHDDHLGGHWFLSLLIENFKIDGSILGKKLTGKQLEKKKKVLGHWLFVLKVDVICRFPSG
jgi:hypothetical protein